MFPASLAGLNDLVRLYVVAQPRCKQFCGHCAGGDGILLSNYDASSGP